MCMLQPMKFEASGKLINTARRAQHWSQAELARRVEVSQQTVSRWEAGTSRPEGPIMSRLAFVLGLEDDLTSALAKAAGYPEPSAVGLPEQLPVRPLAPTLPLFGLSPEGFEQFCRSLLAARHPGVDVHRFGSQGHRQDGIDLYAQPAAGSIFTYQCKRYSETTPFGPRAVEEAVAANKIEAEHHYLLLSRVASPGARKEIMRHAGWTLWDLEDICRILREELDPSDVLGIVDIYFPGHREHFLGEPEVGPWLTGAQAFAGFSTHARLFNHTWSLAGRSEPLRRLHEFAGTEDGRRTMAVSAPGGTGKTRLLKAVIDQLAVSQPGLKVRFLMTGAPVSPTDVEHLPQGRSLLIIDDAQDQADLRLLLASIAVRRPDLRMIMAFRPYARTKIETDVLRSGVDDSLELLDLESLDIGDVELLAAEVIDGDGGDIGLASRVAQLTSDCPLATVLGARLLARHDLNPLYLNNEQTFRKYIFATFENVIAGELGIPGDRPLIRRLLRLVATLHPIAPDDEFFAGLLNTPVDEVRRIRTLLQDAGLLTGGGQSFRLVPDVLADLLVEDACIDRTTSKPTGYADDLFEKVAGRALRNLLVNVGKLDWRLTAAADGALGSEVLDGIWATLQGHLRHAGAPPAVLQAILNVVADVAYYQPERVVALVRVVVPGSSPIPKSEPSQPLLDQGVAAELTKALRNVAYSLEHLPEACDLLWQLADSDDRPLNRTPEHPLRVLKELASYSRVKPTEYCQTVMERALRWLTLCPDRSASALEVLDVLLATEGHDTEADEFRLTLKPFVISAERVRPLRARVIDAAFHQVEHGPLPIAMRALKTIEQALRTPIGLAGYKLTAEDRQQWVPDQVAVLRRLGRMVAGDHLDPVLLVEARHMVSWIAVDGGSEPSQLAGALLDALPDTLSFRLTRGLIDGWDWSNDEQSHHQRAKNSRLDAKQRLAHELIETYPSPNDLIAQLEERLATIHSVTSVRGGTPGPLVATIVETSPAVGLAMVDRVARTVSSPLAGVLAVVLTSLAVHDHDHTVEIARGLLALDELSLDLKVAYAYSLGLGNRHDLIEEEILLIEALARHPDEGVRHYMVAAADNIAVRDRRRGVRLLLSIDVHSSRELADRVLEGFGGRPFTNADLQLSDRQQLVGELRACPSLDQYHIGAFLGELSITEPKDVLDLLRDRINSDLDGDLERFEPLPVTWSFGSPLRFRESEEFEEMLTSILDWLLEMYPSLAFWAPKLFGAVAISYDERVIAMLRSWMTPLPTRQQMETVARALGEADREFIWRHVDLVGELLNLANNIGEECLRTVGGSLYKSAITGSKQGTPGHPFPEDVRLRDLAKERLAVRSISTPERRFYKDLAHHAELGIRWSMDRDLDQ